MTQNYSYYGWTETATVDVATGQGGRLKNITVGGVMNLTYTYDKSGNLRKINSTATVIETQNFTYDTLDRLVTANATGGPANYSETYAYNATTGNLATKGSLTLQYNDSAHAHAVTNAGSNMYSYDNNGNQTTRVIGGQTYTLAYDTENRLVSVSGAATASFVYDGDGKQVKSVINGVTTYLAGAHYHVENGQVTKYYFAGAQRVAVRKNGTLSYLLTDHLGSTLGITNTSGALTAGTLYKAWGETRYTLGTVPTKFKYTGQREESAFGLYFYNARWYDPVSGRFAQADTVVPSTEKGVNVYLVVSYTENSFLDQLNQHNAEILAELRGKKETSKKQINIDSQGLDRFSYTNNNPLKYTDPTGHCLWDLCILEIGFVSIGLIELVAIGGTVVFAAYIYGPNGEQNIESLTNSIISSSEQALESIASLAKGEYVPPGLTGAERDAYREALHRYKDAYGLGPRDNVPKDILDKIGELIKKGVKPSDVVNQAPAPPEEDWEDNYDDWE